MASCRRIIDIFLQFVAAVFLCAFASLFVQIPGLYGDTGILPLKTVLDAETAASTSWKEYPFVLGMLHQLGVDAESGLDFCCLLGILLSFSSLTWKFFRNTVSFVLLWLLYLTIFRVGQTFLWFQWDILLLEVGFLSAILAPYSAKLESRWRFFHQHDAITLWLTKWLLFRLMFSSGVVKLTSHCPTWWGLTALTYHYETQCIPTPLAWYAHQLPVWFQKLSVALTFMIEIVLPFMFFLPSKRHVAFAAWAQIFLMILILLSGNYNFFNWLTIALCLPMVSCISCGERIISDTKGSKLRPMCSRLRLANMVVDIAVYGSLIYFCVRYFSVSISFQPFRIDSSVAFTMSDMEHFLDSAVPLSIFVGIISLGFEILFALYRSIFTEKSYLCKLTNSVSSICFGFIAISLFLISLVPYSVIHQPTRDKLPSTVKKWHSSVHALQLTSSYGLFRHMTGVGGRPEVIIQGSNTMAPDSWMEYEFLYKPGNVSRQPPVVAPHQPRLDWQMWFAALGSYDHNPWFLNLVYRLLRNEKAVLELMAINPFAKGPPRYIRAMLYHYHFTKYGASCTRDEADIGLSNNGTWWCRKFVRQFLPVVSLEDPGFMNYVKKAGLDQDSASPSAVSDSDNKPIASIKLIRHFLGQADGFQLCVSLLASASVLIVLGL